MAAVAVVAVSGLLWFALGVLAGAAGVFLFAAVHLSRKGAVDER